MNVSVELKEQMRVARLANDAYESYLKNYLETRKQSIMNVFQSCENTPEALTHLKHCMDALTALEASIMSDIESGKLASIEINENRSMN